MKKDIKLYNMILPPFLVFALVPWYWLISLAGNFLIDSLVILFASFLIFRKINKNFYKKTILKVWLLGFAADFAGIIYLVLVGTLCSFISFGGYSKKTFLSSVIDGINMAVNSATYYNFWSVLYIVIGIFIAAVAIFAVNYSFTLKKTDLSKKQKLIFSLSLAVLTAPTLF